MTDHKHALGPSEIASVVLDIGADAGALIIFTGPGSLGREIEITSIGLDRPVRTHSAVRERRVRGRTLYGAVFPCLPAGEYIIWRDMDRPAGTVTISEALITEFDWPSDV